MARSRRLGIAASLALAIAGCGSTAPPFAPRRAGIAAAPARLGDAPHVVAPALLEAAPLEQPDERIASLAVRPGAQADAVAVAREPPPEPATGPIELGLSRSRLSLPAGLSVVDVRVAAGHFVSIGLFGGREALLGAALVPAAATRHVRAHGSLEEDGLLPRIFSFRAPAGAEGVTVVVDAAEPIEIGRISADPEGDPRPLVGLPAPRSRDDGYLLQAPARYQFVRLDVAEALLAALRQTRVRFRRDPIAIADISQWDGTRPATDLGHPRHISHAQGRDVDIGLPATDGEASTMRHHCTPVLVEPTVQNCAPGTSKGLDALRLTYFLGLLIDGASPPVEKIFLDEAFIQEVREAAETLREKRWIKDAGYAVLEGEAVLRHSPFHTDHVHVRFAGEPAVGGW